MSSVAPRARASATLLFVILSVLPAGAAEPGPGRQALAPVKASSSTAETVTSKDGTLISYHRMGKGMPLVLVHGATSDHTRFAPVADALSKKFTVYAMDRRGRGGSGDSAHYATEREYEDVAAVLAAAGKPAFLLGHSFGGICALETTLRFDGVRKLILYEPPVNPPKTGDLRLPVYEAMLLAGKNEEVLESFLRESAQLPEKEIEALKRLPTWPARVAAARTIPREMRAVQEYRLDAARLASLRVPTLVLLGGDSPRNRQEGMERLRKAIPASRLVVMPGQQHSAMITAPEMFVRDVTAFLEE